MILGANHSSLGRPCFPLSSSCPRGCCLPVLLPVGSRGVSVRSCGGVWALPDTFWIGLVGLCLGPSAIGAFWFSLCLLLNWFGCFPHNPFCSCGFWGLEFFPPFLPAALGVRVFSSSLLLGVFLLGPLLWWWFSWLQALLWCCCPRTCFSLRPHCFSGVLFCPPLLPLESGCFLGLACCLGCVWSLVFS